MSKDEVDFYALPEPDTVSLSNLISDISDCDMIPPTPGSINSVYNEILRQQEERMFSNKTIFNVFFQDKEITIFNPVAIKLPGTKYKSYETNIVASEIAVTDGMLISLQNNTLRVYKWDSELEFRKIREIRTHLLLFLIRTNSLKKKTRLVLYNIVMTLIEKKIERIDLFLDSILTIMNIDDVDEMYFDSASLVCEYKNGERRIFDSGMKEVAIEVGQRGDDRIEIMKNVVVRERENWIEIDYESKNYVDVIETGEIKQCVYVNEFLFVLGKESIKILKFHK